MSAGTSQSPSPLVGAGVELTEGQFLRGAVERDVSHGGVVAPLRCELGKFGAERDAVRQRIRRLRLEGLGAHADCSTGRSLNSVSR